MKATGIIRRVDDLGRVVIPKELRKNMGINEGQPLEIFTQTVNGKPTIAFQCYSPGEEYDYDTIANILHIITKGQHPYVLCNRDGEVVTSMKCEYPEDQVPTDHTICVNGFDVAYLTTTDGPIGKTLKNVCQAYFNQYE